MIIITGGSRGIGKFLIDEFINEFGDKEILGAYNNTKPGSNETIMHKVDITSPENIKEFIHKNKDILKDIVLVNCAGANYNAYAHKASPIKWADLININLIGTFNMINAVLPIMREDGFGRIINISSVVAQKGIPGTSAYAASKSGLWGMSKAIAVENASKGITVNNLNLGYFQIGMIDSVPLEMQQQIRESIPLKRFGYPIEIYKSVKYLMDNAYITGTSMDINGGLT
jgi:acetoacetyl-CoA reductase/3-oxoacyl-[acyl-carrier protein] reductase